MAHPLMPKATAVWLVDNTKLTFEQIAEFCGLHPLEVQALADGDVGTGIVGTDPVLNGELTRDEIERCENDTRCKLKIVKNDLPKPKARSKGPRYTPVSKRGEKPNAIAWILKKYPDLLDAQIARLIGTTKTTIASIRETHPGFTSLKPVSPVEAGLCSLDEMNKAVAKAERRVLRAQKLAAKQQKLAAAAVPAESAPVTETAPPDTAVSG